MPVSAYRPCHVRWGLREQDVDETGTVLGGIVDTNGQTGSDSVDGQCPFLGDDDVADANADPVLICGCGIHLCGVSGRHPRQASPRVDLPVLKCAGQSIQRGSGLKSDRNRPFDVVFCLLWQFLVFGFAFLCPFNKIAVDRTDCAGC